MQAKSKKKSHRSDYRYWRRVIKEWEAQGLSQEAFCNTHDYNFRQFRYYRHRLKKSDGSKIVKPSVTSEKPSTSFAPIVIKKPTVVKSDNTSAKATVEKQGEFTLEFKNGLRCCIPNHFDAASLRRLVEVLQ